MKVTTPDGTATSTAILDRWAPAFFPFEPENRKYVAAQHADFSLVGHPGLFAGSATTPAKPGETVILYGTGFGPTQPPTPAGKVVTRAAEIDRSGLTLRIGGLPADVQFAGVVQAGLWQFNVKIPDSLSDGDARVEAEIGGLASQGNLFITVQR